MMVSDDASPNREWIVTVKLTQRVFAPTSGDAIEAVTLPLRGGDPDKEIGITDVSAIRPRPSPPWQEPETPDAR